MPVTIKCDYLLQIKIHVKIIIEKLKATVNKSTALNLNIFIIPQANSMFFCFGMCVYAYLCLFVQKYRRFNNKTFLNLVIARKKEKKTSHDEECDNFSSHALHCACFNNNSPFV